MDDFQESNAGHDQTPAYGPSDIPARPMMYHPVRLVYDTPALLLPDDDARPTPLFYYNTSNHVPNSILNNHLWYGNNNYPNASRQCVVMANGFSELSGNDQNATNMTGGPVMFHMNFSNDASCNPSQALQQHPRGSGTPQELPRIQLNCEQQNSFLQHSLQEDDGPRQRLLQQIVSEQREAPGLRETEQRIKPQNMKLQQNSTQDRIPVQKVMKHNVPSHLAMVRPNSAQQNVTQQNSFQQNIILQQQRTFQKEIPEQCCQPTIAFPLQSSYTCNRPQIIINPKRNDFDNICSSTHAIKLKNLPPWVSKQMGFGTSGVDTQKIPETMNLYITVDNEEINRIARKNNRKADVGSQICSVSVANIEDNRRKRTIDSVVVNVVDKRLPAGENRKVENNKTIHSTHESTSCNLLKNYLKKPRTDKIVNFYREHRKSDPSLECDSASSATVDIFKNNEITSTTPVDEGTFKAANLNLDVRYAVNKVNSECSESNSTCVVTQYGKPETRIQFSKTRTTESQTDGEISTLSVNIVKPYNETKRRKNIEKTDNTNERTEAPTKKSDKDLSSTTDTDKEMTKIDDKNDNISTSTEAKILKQKNIDNKCVNKNKNGDQEGNDMERKERNEDQLFKKMTRPNLKFIVDDNDNHVNGELSDINVNLSRSGNRIDLSDRTTNTKERYVLTHVIEGNVIQESNFPFPITPSKEKICIKEKMKRGPLEAIEKCEIKSEKGCSVLYGYTPETIKTWKIHQFVAHFEELGHEGIAKVFQDQELDGEALALVSRRELEAVGIEESLAKELYDFMSAVRPSYYESVGERPLL